MYERKSRLSIAKQYELLKLFVAGSTARAAGEIVGVQANTSAAFFMRLRHLIASKQPSYELSGEVEARAISAVCVKVSVVGALLAKWRYLAS
jgi:transposase